MRLSNVKNECGRDQIHSPVSPARGHGKRCASPKPRQFRIPAFCLVVQNPQNLIAGKRDIDIDQMDIL